MSETAAAQRYARAIVELAVEAGAHEAVHRDLSTMVQAFAAGGGELGAALASPVFSAEERKGVVAAVLAAEGGHPLTRNFLFLVADRGRLGLLPEILDLVTALLDTRAGRVRVEVRTVEALSPELAAEIKAAFEKSTGKTVLLETRLDPTLLGGLVARLGGRVYDASLRTRLEDLKHRLIHAQAPAQA